MKNLRKKNKGEYKGNTPGNIEHFEKWVDSKELDTYYSDENWEKYSKEFGLKEKPKWFKDGEKGGEIEVKPQGELTLYSEHGRGVNQVRYWKDEKGNYFYDPHPKIDYEPGSKLIHTEKVK